MNCFPLRPLSHCKLHHLSLGRWTQKRSRSIPMKKWKPWFAAKPLGTWQLFNGSDLVQTWFKHVHLVEVMVNLEIEEPKGNKRNNYMKGKKENQEEKKRHNKEHLHSARHNLQKSARNRQFQPAFFPFPLLFILYLSCFLFPLWKVRSPHQRSLKHAWTQFALHSTLYALCSTLHTLHSTLHTLDSTPYALHSTLYTPHTLYTLHSTLQTPHSTL